MTQNVSTLLPFLAPYFPCGLRPNPAPYLHPPRKSPRAKRILEAYYFPYCSIVHNIDPPASLPLPHASRCGMDGRGALRERGRVAWVRGWGAWVAWLAWGGGGGGRALRRRRGGGGGGRGENRPGVSEMIYGLKKFHTFGMLYYRENLDGPSAPGAKSAMEDAGVDYPKTRDFTIVSGEIWDQRRRRGAVVTPMLELSATMVDAGKPSVAMIAAATESGCSWWCGAESGPPLVFCPFGNKSWL